MALVPEYILILFAVIIIDFFSAIQIEKAEGQKRKIFLVFSLLSNISILCFFKYFNFLNENITQLFGVFGSDIKPYNLNIILPIGLSFHTFQSMAYTIEVYRGNQKAERHIGYFSNYVLFFPQMVAGPIERYDTLGNELRKEHNPKYENFAAGFRLILFGLFIKMVVADNLAPIVNEVYESPEKYNSIDVLTSMILFSFQIYADFFGYSTIAIGAARLLGVSIMDNFKTPYLSSSITEFWKRWHISLGSWFRDYLYISLGGNKVSLMGWVFNILVVFLISGLWHGAAWTFVVWGGLHGLMIIMERFFIKMTKLEMSKNRFLKPVLILKTFIITTFIWVFFRAESFAKAKLVFHSLLKNWSLHDKDIDYGYSFVFILVLIIIDIVLNKSRIDYWLKSMVYYKRWSVYAVLIFCIMAMAGVENFAFIYFQF